MSLQGVLPVLAGALLFSLVASPAAAQRPAADVDTSDWVCELCPFEKGLQSDYDVGTTVVSDDSAILGDATGYDEEGTYLNVGADGSYVREGGLRLDWQLNELGLDTRSADIGLAQPGRFDSRIAYRELPRREFNTTRSIFASNGSGTLLLPEGWVRAGNTAAFSALGANLAPRNIQSDRSEFAIGGRFLPSTRWSLDADYRSQRRTGNNILGGSYYTIASLLPMSFVYETDEVDLGVSYFSDRGSLSLSWYLSDFESGGPGFGWESPFTTAPGAEFATLAQPPSNTFQQLSLSGGYRFDAMSAFARFSLSMGRIEQNERLLGYTSNANLAPGALPRNSLDGEVDTTRFAFTAGARPLPGSRIRFSASYDERDNGTPRETWTRVIADTFLSDDPELNNPFSYERLRLSLDASYDVLDSTRLTGGLEYRSTDRSLQEVAEQDELKAFGGARWQPGNGLTIRGEFGTSRRDIDRYDETLAQSFGQNPIMRKYNLAYRYREFAEFGADGSLAEGRLGWSLSASFADDSYTESRLGLLSADEMALGAELNWAVSESASLYVHGGLESIESVQAGSEFFGEPDWRATNQDDFVTIGAGMRLMQLADKFDLQIDVASSDGQSAIDMDTATGGRSAFPDLETRLVYVNAELSFAWSEQLDITAMLRYQDFRSDDWALQGVEPATIPSVLSLGADPWNAHQLLVGVSFRYTVGANDSAN